MARLKRVKREAWIEGLMRMRGKEKVRMKMMRRDVLQEMMEQFEGLE